ncbi:MAG: TolC family protein [Bacteroidota bacterium]
MYRLLISCFFLFSLKVLLGQNTLTLADCLSRAEAVSLELQRADLGVSRLQLETESTAAFAHPTLDFGSRAGLQNGRSIDPTTNAFADQQLLFSTYNLQADWLIYNGGRLKQEALRFQDLQLAQLADISLQKRQLHLEVIFAYLSAQQAESATELNQQSLQNTRSQLRQLDQLVAAGVKRPNDRLELELRLNTGIRDSILGENELNRQHNRLRQLLQLPYDQDVVLTKTEALSLNSSLYTELSGQELLLELQERDPGLVANEARISAAGRRDAIIRANRAPEVRLFGVLTTNHSSIAQRVEGTVNAMAAQEVFLGGQATTLEVAQQLPVFGADPYFNQLRNNFSQIVGLNINFNILDGGRNRRERQVAQLEQREAQLGYQQYWQELQDQLFRQLSDLEDARTNYFASQQQLDNLRSSLTAAEQSYRAGGLSTFELVRVQTAVEEAELQLNQALYDCIFRYELLMTLLAD